jgi:hypothetical protein
MTSAQAAHRGCPSSARSPGCCSGHHLQPVPLGRPRRRPGLLRAAAGIDQHDPRAVQGQLGHVHRDVVQPLAGDDQAADPVRQRCRPADPAVAPGGVRGDLDRARNDPLGKRKPRASRAGAGGQVLGERQDLAQQLALAGADVHQVEPLRVPEGRVHVAEQREDGSGVARRGVHRGPEVRRGAFPAGVEAVPPVQRVLGGGPPCRPHGADSSGRLTTGTPGLDSGLAQASPGPAAPADMLIVAVLAPAAKASERNPARGTPRRWGTLRSARPGSRSA